MSEANGLTSNSGAISTLLSLLSYLLSLLSTMKLTESQKERLVKAIKYLAVAVATAVAMALGLTSCNVTRTITTESRSLTRGDTAIIIQSKTIESYNAKKN